MTSALWPLGRMESRAWRDRHCRTVSFQLHPELTQQTPRTRMNLQVLWSWLSAPKHSPALLRKGLINGNGIADWLTGVSEGGTAFSRSSCLRRASTLREHSLWPMTSLPVRRLPHQKWVSAGQGPSPGNHFQLPQTFSKMH